MAMILNKVEQWVQIIKLRVGNTINLHVYARVFESSNVCVDLCIHTCREPG